MIDLHSLDNMQYNYSSSGVAYCGDPPAIAEPGKVVVNKMEALYSCPSDKFRLGGVTTRKCNAKNKEETKWEWEPSQDQASFCLEAK